MVGLTLVLKFPRKQTFGFIYASNILDRIAATTAKLFSLFTSYNRWEKVDYVWQEIVGSLLEILHFRFCLKIIFLLTDAFSNN